MREPASCADPCPSAGAKFPCKSFVHDFLMQELGPHAGAYFLDAKPGSYAEAWILKQELALYSGRL